MISFSFRQLGINVVNQIFLSLPFWKKGRIIPTTTIWISLLLVGSVSVTTLAVDAQSVENPPNIVVIVADDLGWNDIGYNGSEVQTPNLDRLAENGIKLNQFYAYSTCSPTRVGLLTGQNPAIFNVFGPLGATTEVQPADMLLLSELQDAGYTNHISGKWHIGDIPENRPLRYGFTSSYGYLRGQIDPYTHRYKYGDYVTWHRNDHFIEEEGHVTDLITDEAIRVIKIAAEVRSEPFFLYVAHHAPHFPHNSPPKWIEPYEDVFDDVWKRHNAAVITHMDHEIGRIVDTLERTGQLDNTIIFFLSDNGGQQSWPAPDTEYNGRYAAHTTLGDNSPFRGWKGDLYEGGIRVPAFVNWPGVLEGGGRIDSPTHVLDLTATILHLAQPADPLPDKLDGYNLLPILVREQPQAMLDNRRMFWRQSGIRAVRDGDWKLIARGTELNDPELFNIGEDPYEKREIGGQNPEKREELLELLREWQGHTSE